VADILESPRQQGVEAENLVALREESVAQVRPEKPCPSRY